MTSRMTLMMAEMMRRMLDLTEPTSEFSGVQSVVEFVFRVKDEGFSTTLIIIYRLKRFYEKKMKGITVRWRWWREDEDLHHHHDDLAPELITYAALSSFSLRFRTVALWTDGEEKRRMMKRMMVRYANAVGASMEGGGWGGRGLLYSLIWSLEEFGSEMSLASVGRMITRIWMDLLGPNAAPKLTKSYRNKVCCCWWQTSSFSHHFALFSSCLSATASRTAARLILMPFHLIWSTRGVKANHEPHPLIISSSLPIILSSSHHDSNSPLQWLEGTTKSPFDHPSVTCSRVSSCQSWLTAIKRYFQIRDMARGQDRQAAISRSCSRIQGAK